MKKEISFIQSIAVVLVLLAIIFVSLFMLKLPPHIPLIFGVAFISVIGFLLKYKWTEMEKGILDGVRLGIKPILILMLIGMLIAIWMVGGTIPTILSYGFHWISPQYFLISALVITVLVSTFTGSSLTTVSTVGVALFGVGTAIGVHPGLAAGMIVSGAVFGDKMSPLSDTTNFASGIVEVPLPKHIQHITWTTVPSIVITAIIALVIGMNGNHESVNYGEIQGIQEALKHTFNLHVLTLLSPLLVLIFSMRRVDVLPTLVLGIVTAIITGMITQHEFTLSQLLGVLQSGPAIESGNKVVDAIVNKGGLQSMMFSISLIMIALSLGGLMRAVGIIDALLEGLAKQIRRSGDVIFATLLSSIGVNVITGEQYLSILLPGQTFKPLYEKWNLDPKNLSRTLEDGGTVINAIIPWGVSGAFISTALNIPAADYIPFTFFSILCPIFSIILANTGIGIAKKKAQS
ncbi:Na+/H+ antiporter NhaC [Priestia sp. TRN 1309]|uniref:Na+/H+ antiporter NhaC n=1 Tax=Priestia sp. TRN 1309 TaxID=3420729 RepID=UPI003D774203